MNDFNDSQDPKHTLFCRKNAFFAIYAFFSENKCALCTSFFWAQCDLFLTLDLREALILKKQARKSRSYASLKLRLTDLLTGVKCRATSVAKKYYCDAADPEDSSRDTLRHSVTGDPRVTNIQTQTPHSAKKPRALIAGDFPYKVQ